MKIAFVHPDLGIGGAERLVIDAAIGLKQSGHQVTIYTSHYDPLHCFPETDIIVRADWLPRHVFGRGHIIFAILRGLYLAISILMDLLFGKQDFKVIIVDQLSAPIPLLRLSSAKILFYCHFPDKLLTKRESLLKKLYRWPIDAIEELTTKMADCIAVNSNFTAGVFKESFKLIEKKPFVLYPGIRCASYDNPVDLHDCRVQLLNSKKRIILSINRFERKKNVQLAIEAFAQFELAQTSKDEYILVLAGGHDPRIMENVDYLQELGNLAKSFDLAVQTIYPSNVTKLEEETQVLLLASFSDSQRTYLLSKASMLLYTPSNEHFGIVPIEAMYASVPVIAVNNGGPVETVIEGKTGFLCEPKSSAFARAMTKVIKENAEMGANGRRHVQQRFSIEAFVDTLENIIKLVARGQGNCHNEGIETFERFVLGCFGVVLLVMVMIYTF